MVAAEPIWRAPSLRPGESIVRFNSPTSAVVATEGTEDLSRLEAIGTPLAAYQNPGTPSDPGPLRPIALDLEPRAAGWVPKRAAVPISIPRRTTDRVVVGQNLSVGLGQGSDAGTTGALAAATKVFYAEVATDTDAFVEPVADGVSVSWLLRSPASPTQLRFDLGSSTLDGGRVNADGSLTVRNGDRTVGTVSAPIGVDAQGTAVTTRFVTGADGVNVEIRHLDHELAYPIAVDPVVRSTSGGAYVLEQDDKNGSPARPDLDGFRPHTFQTDSFTFGETSIGRSIVAKGNGSGSAWWAFQPIRNSAPYRAQFAGVTLTNSAGGTGACQRLGIGDGNSSFAPTALYRYWAGSYSRGGATPWNGSQTPSPTGSGVGTYDDCSGTRGSSFVEVCAKSDCGSVAAADNYVAFQLNTPGGGATSYFAGAYVYHRENVKPTVVATPNWAADLGSAMNGPWSSFPNGMAVNVAAHDDGVGLCGDAANGFPPVVVLKDTAQTAPLGTAGNDGCTGMTYDRPAPTDHGYSLKVPQASIPEGLRLIRGTVVDAVGNANENMLLAARVDRSGPNVALSGDLFTNRSSEISASETRSLAVQATDGIENDNLADWRSGVGKIELFIDGEVVDTVTQTASGDNKALSASWGETDQYLRDGSHVVKVVATDRIGNATTSSFSVVQQAEAALSGPGTGDPGFYSFVDIDDASGARINVASGNLLIAKEDIPTAGTTVPLLRVYNSLGDDPTNGRFGARWGLSLDRTTRVRTLPDGDVEVRGPTRDTVLSEPNDEASGGFEAPDGYDSHLIDTDTGWLLQQTNDSTLDFSVTGRLRSTTDTDGSQSTIRYGGDEEVSWLTSYETPTLDIEIDYDSDTRLATAMRGSNGDGADTHYGYRNGRLETRTVDGDVTRYGYDANGHLNYLTTPGGSIYSFTSDAAGRVLRATREGESGIEEVWTFTYSGARETTVRIPNGTTTTYTFDGDGRVIDSNETESTLPESDDTDDPSQTEPHPLVTVPAENLDQIEEGELIPGDNEPAVSLEPDDDGAAQRGFWPRRYKVRIKGPDDEDEVPPGGNYATFRNKAGSLIIGNAKNGTTFDGVKEVVGGKKNTTRTYFGRLYGHNNACGWFSAGALGNGRSTDSPGCARTGPAVKKFARLINCDRCNRSTSVRVKLTDENGNPRTSVPIYRNARPYAKRPKLTEWVLDFNVRRDNGTRATVGWRYITSNPNIVAISTSTLGHGPKGTYGDRWAFMRTADLEPLCPELPKGKPTKAKNHKSWPNVCIIGKPPEKPTPQP
jgi:YD repeat-containing protein